MSSSAKLKIYSGYAPDIEIDTLNGLNVEFFGSAAMDWSVKPEPPEGYANWWRWARAVGNALAKVKSRSFSRANAVYAVLDLDVDTMAYREEGD